MFLYNRNGDKTHETIFDIVFLDEVKKYNKGYSYKHRNTRYVITNLNKEQQEIHGKTKLRLHQLVLPYKKPFMIDYRDHDGLNNRLSNLRIVTNRQNCENKLHNRNKHGLVGISFHKRDKVFTATIQVNSKNKHVGNFKTKEEAYEAREKYKLENKL